MNEVELKSLIDKGRSTRQIADSFNISQTTVNYWVKKLKLELKTQKFNVKENPYKCACGENDSRKFNKTKRYICKVCHNKYTVAKANEKRRKAIDYLGGKCQKCPYNKYIGAMDFHHLDPTKKNKNFKHLKFWSWEKIVKELEGCIILCKNCHAEEHA